MQPPVQPNAIDRLWTEMRAATPARIGLARAGAAVATREHLAFQLAHAGARDAVLESFDSATILEGLAARHLPALHVRSKAVSREDYLLRPDLGRELDGDSRGILLAASAGEIVFVLADGLSARAAHDHALPLLDAVLPLLHAQGLKPGPFVLAEQARVALGDQIGEALRASLVIVMIGERPGLTSPDSLGVYLTWMPRTGRTDAERNCLSNIRAEGMSYAEAAGRLAYLCAQARKLGMSGVMLKDEWKAVTSLPGPG